MPKARKDHICGLCFEVIPKEEKYHRQSITPWDHPDNDGFFELKAHLKCLEIWEEVGGRGDWIFPTCESDWKELIGYREGTAKTGQDAAHE